MRANPMQRWILLAARAQVDVLFTNHSGQSQASPSLFLGVVYRR